jgi:hypothetical protein
MMPMAAVKGCLFPSGRQTWADKLHGRQKRKARQHTLARFCLQSPILPGNYMDSSSPFVTPYRRLSSGGRE